MDFLIRCINRLRTRQTGRMGLRPFAEQTWLQLRGESLENRCLLSIVPVSFPPLGQATSDSPSISADGRYVAFASSANNLVAGDVNNESDVFVRDVQSGAITLVSTGSSGQGNYGSVEPSISGDGRYVAFTSYATNLVSGDTNGQNDVFLRDLQNNTTTRMSIGSSGQGNNASFEPSLSADGQFVAFTSFATNLVAGDTNGKRDVFVRDLQNNTTTRVSSGNVAQGDNDSYDPSISANGRYVAFTSLASNLVPDFSGFYSRVVLKDLQSNSVTHVSAGSVGIGGSSGESSISADGRYVVFSSHSANLVGGDTNSRRDVFLRDLQDNVTTRVSVGASGQANGDSSAPGISADGRYLTFTSSASNLIDVDTNGQGDIFYRDLLAGAIFRVSAVDQVQGNNNSIESTISADGKFVAFSTYANNLTVGDTNQQIDVLHWSNEVPTAFSQTVFVGQNTARAFTLVATDPAGLPLTYSVLAQPLHGTLSGTAPNLVYTPVADFMGSDELAFKVSNGVSDSPIARLSISVIDSIPPIVAYTSLTNSGLVLPGATALQVTFSRSVFAAELVENYQLHSAGPDNVLGTGDDVQMSISSATVSGSTATLNFAPLPEGEFRLTVLDLIASSTGIRLDGDGDGQPLGNHIVDFAADASPPTIVSTSTSEAGAVLPGTVALQITFSRAVSGASAVSKYQLREAGFDGLPGTADDVATSILSAVVNGNAVTLRFFPLIESVYRLTVLDTITNLAGVRLDGDEDGQPLGNYVETFVSTVSQAGAGALDVSFGETGKVFTPIGSADEVATATAVQPDGRIIVVGTVYNGVKSEFAVARYNADGSPDVGFGANGRTTTAIGSGNSFANALVLQPDGKLVAVGSSGGSFALVRYNVDGSLDDSFGTGGKVTTQTGSQIEGGAGAAALQPDGKIVVSGCSGSLTFIMIRYNSDGTLDSSFGVGGRVTNSLLAVSSAGSISHSFTLWRVIIALALQPNGKIVVGGLSTLSATFAFALLRFNGDGTLDSTFGADGRVLVPSDGNSNTLKSLIMQPDGRIVAIGTSRYTPPVPNVPPFIPFHFDLTLMRFHGDGSIDTSFGPGGKVVTLIGSGSDDTTAATAQPDGKIVVAGYGGSFVAARYNPDGSLDTSFGTGGRTKAPQRLGPGTANALALQPDGRIVVVGYAPDSTLPKPYYHFALVRFNVESQAVEVTGQNIFYNNSKFDGNASAAAVSDDAALAPDKSALLPGGTATFANYTSFSRGINGIAIDIASRPARELTSNDFQFRIGNDNELGGWSFAPEPASFKFRSGAGSGGADRISLTWPDGAIKNTWLEVTVLPTSATGLAEPYVFYFGNAVGESGDSAQNAVVNATDELGARNHPQTFLDPAAIDNIYDFNRDGLVNATDQIIARSNTTTLATALKLISVPGNVQESASAAPPLPAKEDQQMIDGRIAFGLAAARYRFDEPNTQVRLGPTMIPLVPAAVGRRDERELARMQAICVDRDCDVFDYELAADDSLYDLIADELLASRV